MTENINDLTHEWKNSIDRDMDFSEFVKMKNKAKRESDLKGLKIRTATLKENIKKGLDDAIVMNKDTFIVESYIVDEGYLKEVVKANGWHICAVDHRSNGKSCMYIIAYRNVEKIIASRGEASKSKNKSNGIAPWVAGGLFILLMLAYASIQYNMLDISMIAKGW